MVGKLRGVSYDWKASGRNDIGLIAEEVAQVVPVVVSFDSATGQAQGLDYARLTALLIEAVKQQSKQLDALKAENADLKAQALKRAAAAEQENERLIETVEVLKARLEKLERSVGSYVLAAKAE